MTIEHKDKMKNQLTSGETYTPTADLTPAKLLFNIVVYPPGDNFFYLSLFNFYLITPFNDPSE